MKSKLLLVDFSNVLFRGLAMNDSLEDSEGRFTGGLYGFIIMLAAKIREHKPKSVIICLDSPPYHRQLVYEGYKGDREKPSKKTLDRVAKGLPLEKTEGVQVPLSDLRQESLPYCRRFLDLMEIPVAEKQGYEADDMIAHFTRQLYHEFDEILIDSNDSDLYQLLDPECKIACLKKSGLYTYPDFLNEWDGITQEQLITCLSMIGTHNAVEGIKGVGPKTAIKIVRSLSKTQEIKDRYPGLIERNRELIVLPWGGIENFELDNIFVPQFCERPLLNFLAEFDIKLTDKMTEAFEWIGETVHDII